MFTWNRNNLGINFPVTLANPQKHAVSHFHSAVYLRKEFPQCRQILKITWHWERKEQALLEDVCLTVGTAPQGQTTAIAADLLDWFQNCWVQVQKYQNFLLITTNKSWFTLTVLYSTVCFSPSTGRTPLHDDLSISYVILLSLYVIYVFNIMCSITFPPPLLHLSSLFWCYTLLQQILLLEFLC